ncbi:MAG: FAD-dependent oxidoreductase, partial [Bacteroidaceae bacterium]|nr:FAD-dependent oxidoreductase [Bacteroidaceae bacterium]
FGLIPGLENAEFYRYGVMHRNTYLNSPKLLNADYSLRNKKGLFFAASIPALQGKRSKSLDALICCVLTLQEQFSAGACQ